MTNIIKGKVLNADGTPPSTALLDAANALVQAKITEINALNKQTETLQQQRATVCGTNPVCRIDFDKKIAAVVAQVSIAVNELNSLKSQATSEQMAYDNAVATYQKIDPTYIAAAGSSAAAIEVAKGKKTMYIIIAVTILIAVVVFVWFKYRKK